MPRTKYSVVICMFLTLVLAPTVFAGSLNDPIVFTGLFLIASLFSWWFATVVMIFGMTFLQGFLLGYLVLLGSLFSGESYRREDRSNGRPPTIQDAPKRTSLDPLRFMNLS